MNVGLLLNLYQPITQNPDVFHKVYAECYSPLLKFLKSSRNLNITINVPLSLLQQLDYYGYKSWIDGVKELVNSGRVELVGCGAYHPILPKLRAPFIDQQIVLNEYGLGYYFGKHTGFDGEKSILIQNLNGFFPPEMAVNMELIHELNELGYKWVIVDECALATMHKHGLQHVASGVYMLEGLDIRIVSRDRTLSNLLSFKRDTSVTDVITHINRVGADKNFVVCLDGEFFGHHFKNGLFVLDFLVQEIEGMGGKFETVGDIVSNSDETTVKQIDSSSWGATNDNVLAGNALPLWDVSTNKIQTLQWQLVDLVMDNFLSFFKEKVNYEDCETLPIWKPEALSKIPDDGKKRALAANILVNNFLNSDQFWWASKATIAETTYLFNPTMILNSLKIATDISKLSGDTDFEIKVTDLVDQITKLVQA